MSQENERLIFFRLAGGGYALRLRDVAEVMEPQHLYPIPCAPPCFPGVMNSHGRLVSVLDLSAYLFGSALDATGQLLILDPCLANLAIRVIEVESIRDVDMLSGLSEGNDPVVEKVLTWDGGRGKLLSVEELLRCLDVLLEQTAGVTFGRDKGESPGG